MVSYLSQPRGLPLPNERTTIPAAERPAPGGWLIALAITLVALPVWLLLRLQPFLAEWHRVVGYIAAADIWHGANAGGAGLVVLPIAAALTPRRSSRC